MRITRPARNALGMSLVELMIVVVIIGILAAIAVVGYRKYIAHARVSEATAMLAEFVAKEQLYFLDNGRYSEAHAGGSFGYPSAEEGSFFWPHNPNEYWDSAREAFAVDPVPNSWRALGVRSRWPQLFCTYFVTAGPPGAAPSGAVGQSLFAGTPGVPWFYALAACNLSGVAGWPNGAANYVTTLALTHDSPAMRRTDEFQ